MSTNSDILTASELNHFLREVYDKGYTTKTLKLNRPLYNEVAERIFFYCFARAEAHKPFLVAMDKDPGEIAGVITMRILDRFDTLWSCTAPNPAGLASVSATNAIRDVGRSHKRRTAHFYPIGLDDLNESLLIDNAVPRGEEERYIEILNKAEYREKALYIIDEHLPARTLFQVVSFFTTQVLAKPRITPKLLAPQLDQWGLTPVADYYFHILAKQLDVPLSKLTCCRHSELPPYKNLEDLQAKIAQASFACKKAFFKALGPHFKTI